MNVKRGISKVIWAYLVSLALFAIFLYPFMGIIKNYQKWLPIYSLVFFLLAGFLIFIEMRKLARAEKRDTIGSISYPYKGLVIGAFSTLPIIVLEALLLISFGDKFFDRYLELAIKTLLGPFYWIIKAGNGSIAAYLVILLVLPLMAMLFYLSGYYNIPAAKVEKIKQNSETFKKSPWNPSAPKKTQKNRAGKAKDPGGK
jgi:hypothetical protein